MLSIQVRMMKTKTLKTNAALRRDPTQTTTLRAAYARELRSRFGRIKRLINSTVVENDFFRLTDRRQPLSILASPAQSYDFPSDQNRWLRIAVDSEILEVIEREGVRSIQRGEFQNTYVRRAYFPAWLMQTGK